MQDWQKIGTASPNDTIFSWQNVHWTDNVLNLGLDIIRTGNRPTSKVFDMTE